MSDIYCEQCGACGEPGCCNPGGCKYVKIYQNSYDDQCKLLDYLYNYLVGVYVDYDKVPYQLGDEKLDQIVAHDVVDGRTLYKLDEDDVAKVFEKYNCQHYFPTQSTINSVNVTTRDGKTWDVKIEKVEDGYIVSSPGNVYGSGGTIEHALLFWEDCYAVKVRILSTSPDEKLGASMKEDKKILCGE